MLPTATSKVLIHHFVTEPWYRDLEDYALEFLAGQKIAVHEYWPHSQVSKIEVGVRHLSAEEKKHELRHFADNYRAIEFSICEASLESIAGSDVDLPPDYSVEDFIDLSLRVELERFADIYLFLISLATWGAFEPGVATCGGRKHWPRRSLSDCAATTHILVS